MLLGDTALTWLLVMLLFLLFSPIHTMIELAICTGHFLKNTIMSDVEDCFGGSEVGERRYFTSIFLMGLSLLPLILAATCVIYPFVFLGRLWQISKIFFVNIAGQCLRKCFCCCCY